MLVILTVLKMLVLAIAGTGGICLVCCFGLLVSRTWTTPTYTESPGTVVLALVPAIVFSISLMFAGFTAPKPARLACSIGIALFFLTLSACPQEQSRR